MVEAFHLNENDTTIEKKITMTSIRRAVSTIVQETHDERLFGVLWDQLTHSKLVAHACYTNHCQHQAIREKVHGNPRVPAEAGQQL